MDFKELGYLVGIAAEQSLSRAAEKLIVDQSTLSKALARLEEKAGCPLFTRNQHGLTLTEEGEHFLEVSRRLLKLKGELDDEMRAIAKGLAGRIHLGISYTFSKTLVPKVLPVFSRDNPGVEVFIHTETSADLAQMLVDGDIDVAVMADAKKNKQLAQEVLFHEQILLAVSPDNPLSAKGKRLDGEDFLHVAPRLLVGERFILSQERMRLRETADAFFRAEGMVPEIAVTTASISTALHLASHNVGIAFIPLSYTLDPIDPPAPVFLSTDDTLADWKVSIAVSRKNRKSPLLNRFIKAFKDAM